MIDSLSTQDASGQISHMPQAQCSTSWGEIMQTVVRLDLITEMIPKLQHDVICSFTD